MSKVFDAKKARGNPYYRPTLYDVIGLDPVQGVATGKAKIGDLVNRATRKARSADVSTEERHSRIAAVNTAKEILLQPGERVLLDFFILPTEVLASVCKQLAERFATGELPTQAVIGSFFPKQRFDDLIPESLDRFTHELQAIAPPKFFEEAESADGRLPLAVVEL